MNPLQSSRSAHAHHGFRADARPGLAVLSALLLLFVLPLLAGCGEASGDDAGNSDAAASADASEASGTEITAGEDSGDSNDSTTGGDRSELPDGFPDDLPVPEHSSLRVQDLPSSTVDGWMLLFSIPGAGDRVVDDYADDLAAAGFSPEAESQGNITAEGSGWTVWAHSSAKDTLTVNVETE